jgi:hypothetical protein
MGKSKFRYQKSAIKTQKNEPSNLTRPNEKTPIILTRPNAQTLRFITVKNRKPPTIQINHAFNFIPEPEPEPDKYYFQIPNNYIDKEIFPEDAEIKELFIRDMEENGISNKNLIVGQLNGICKGQHAIEHNIQTQSHGTMVLYIEHNNDVKVAATILLDFEKDYEEDEEDNNEPYEIEKIRIYSFCSKERGYGTKLMKKIIELFYVGIDNRYILDDAKIILNYTVSSKPFYEKLGFDCTDTHNKICSFSQVMERPNVEAAGKTTGRKTTGRKQNARKTTGRKTTGRKTTGRKTTGRKTTQRRSKK